ncbi:MAG: DUF5616 domain-containing protein, partial [Bacteroidota bacterium]
WPWEIDLVYNPDKTIAETQEIAVSCDSWVIDHAPNWFNLLDFVIDFHGVDCRVLEMGGGVLGGTPKSP